MDGAATKRSSLSLGIAWFFNALDLGLLTFVVTAIQKDWQLTPGQTNWVGLITLFGIVIGALISGILADQVNRKKILIVMMFLFAISTGLCAIVDNLQLFLVLRFFSGIGTGGELPVIITFLFESMTPKFRSKAVILLGIFWSLGWLVATISSYRIIPLGGWRLASLVPAVAFFYAFYLIKSVDGATSTHVKKEHFLTPLNQIFKKPFITLTLKLCICWFMVMFAYCGIVFWFPTLIMMRGHSAVNSYWYTLLITAIQIPGYYLAAWLVEKIGRKVVISIFSVGIAVGAILFAVTTQKTILLFSGLLASFFSLGSWGIIQVYTAEQYPVFSRATAMGLACGFSQVGGALATMLVGNLIKMNWSVIMIFSLFLVALLITNLIVISLKDDADPQKEV